MMIITVSSACVYSRGRASPPPPPDRPPFPSLRVRADSSPRRVAVTLTRNKLLNRIGSSDSCSLLVVIR